MIKCGHCLNFDGPASAVLEHQKKCKIDPKWGKVVDLVREGRTDEAKRKAKRLLGVKSKGKPMSEETKEYLRQRREERAKAGVVRPSPRRR